jgi:hypothetical protein
MRGFPLFLPWPADAKSDAGRGGAQPHAGHEVHVAAAQMPIMPVRAPMLLRGCCRCCAPAPSWAPTAASPALPAQGATNFAVFASNTWGMSLCLFTEADLRAGRVTLEVPLSPEANRTGDVWHVALPGLDPSLLYGYRAFGANEQLHEESEGQRHDAVSCRLGRMPLPPVRCMAHAARLTSPPSQHRCLLLPPPPAEPSGAGPVCARRGQRAAALWGHGPGELRTAACCAGLPAAAVCSSRRWPPALAVTPACTLTPGPPCAHARRTCSTASRACWATRLRGRRPPRRCPSPTAWPSLTGRATAR